MTSNVRRKRGHDDYRVAIICPLEVETSAMRYMLDEEHAEIPAPEGDPNQYICGMLQGHNVVIAHLPQGSQGVGAAAVVATHMKRTFPHATLRMLVGIGGGVPSEQHDIRLGDVVISMPDDVHGGVVQYDLGKDTVTGFVRKGSLQPPPDEWRSCVIKMQSDHRVRVSRVSEFVNNMIQQYPSLEAYRRPAAGQDVLYSPKNNHIAGQPTCKDCDQTRVIQRTPPKRDFPNIFYGLIASGNRVVKDASLRDRIAQDAGGALCFEMEAAGLMNDFRCLVVRGISDYADSHKNDDYHAYGAAVAAAYAKELLSYTPISTTPGSTRIDRNLHWTVTRTINPFFRGRTGLIADIVSEVRNALQDSHVQHRIVITGMGGQGKSEMCLHVASQVRELFWGVFWVDVNTVTSAETGFSTVATLLDLARGSVDDVRLALANLKHLWLLILDNADDTTFDYQKYLPTGDTGVVIITSRNHRCHQYATLNPITLHGLDLATSQELLLTAARIPDVQRDGFRAAAGSVALDLLQGHPLAILQAGAYVSQGHCLISEYTTVFQRRRKRLLTFRPSQVQSQYEDVYNTFETSSDALQASTKQVAKDALDLMSVLSMCALGDLGLTIFHNAWKEAQRILNYEGPDKDEMDRLNTWHVSKLLPLLSIEDDNDDDDEWDSFRLIEAVSLLEAYALFIISGSGDTKSVSMHPLIHAWARDRQNQKQQQESWLRAGCMLAMSVALPGLLNQAVELRPHFQALLSMKGQVMLDSGPQLMIVRLLLNIGYLLQSVRLDKELSTLLRLLGESLGLEVGNVSTQWLVYYHLVGRNLLDLAQDEAAIACFEQICKIEEQTLPEDDPQRLSSQNELASAYLANGQALEAVALFEKAVVIKGRKLPRYDDELLASQHGLARAYLKSGQLHESIALFQWIVWVRAQTLAEDHPNLLASQYGLARAYQDNWHLPQAIELLEKVVKVRKHSLPEDHPDRLLSQHQLGLAYLNNEQAQEAVTALEDVVKAQDRCLPKDDPQQQGSQHALAGAYLANNQTQEAITLFKAVVNIRDQTLPEDDPNQLASRFELARAYIVDEQFQEAVSLLLEIDEIEARTLAADHQNRLLTQYHLSIAYWKLGERETARGIMARVVEIQRRAPDVFYLQRRSAEAWFVDMGLEENVVGLQKVDIN